MPTPEPIPAQIRTLAQRAANGTWVGAGDLTPIAAELERGSTYDRVMRLGTLTDAVDGQWHSPGGLAVREPRSGVWIASWGRLCGGPGANPDEALRRLEVELRDRARWLLDLPAQRDVDAEACDALEAVL